MFNDKFVKLDETTRDVKFQLGGIIISKQKLFTNWLKITENEIDNEGFLVSKNWNNVLTFPYLSFTVNAYNYGEKNLFVLGYPGLMYHYNSTDWAIEIIINGKKVENACFASMWTDGKTMVIADSDHSKIYRGK